MSKYRPMVDCCGKPMEYHWNVGTRQVKGYWQFKCYTCGKGIRV